MNKQILVALIIIGIGLSAFALDTVLWPSAPEMAMPPADKLPFFLVLALAEALLFGFGIAFIGLGWPLIRRATATVGVRAWPLYVSIAWQLLSWWPHDNFHRAVGLNSGGVLLIEYAFHGTLMITAVVLARFLLVTLRQSQPGAFGVTP